MAAATAGTRTDPTCNADSFPLTGHDSDERSASIAAPSDHEQQPTPEDVGEDLNNDAEGEQSNEV